MNDCRLNVKNMRRRSRSESKTPGGYQCSAPKLKRSHSQNQIISCTPLYTPQISRIPAPTSVQLNRGTLSAKKSIARLQFVTGPKSPVQVKQAYTGLNEKDCLRRIRNYFENMHPEITISKPPTIQQFVDVVRCLLIPLCGPTQAQISVKNYKTFLPKCMTSLHFPFSVSQSFLKCPNTPHNFQQVCSIWIFLLDLVEPISSQEGNTFDSIKTAQLKYIMNKKYSNEETCKEELIAEIFYSKNINRESLEIEYQQCKDEIEEYKRAEREALNEYRLLAEDLEVYQKEIIGNQVLINNLYSEEVQCNEKIKNLQDKLECNDQMKHESMMKDLELKILEINQQLQSITVSKFEVDQVARELERKQRQLGHLREREREYQEKYNAIQAHNTAILRTLEEDTFRCNTQIQLNEFIPKDIKQQLILDEMNVDTKQAKQAMEKIDQLISDVKSQKNIIDINVRKTTSKLAEAEETINRIKSEISEADAEKNQLEVDIETLNNSIQMKKEEYEALSVDLVDQKKNTIMQYQRFEAGKNQLANSKRILESKLESATQISNDQLDAFNETTYSNLQYECKVLSKVLAKLEKDTLDLNHIVQK